MNDNCLFCYYPMCDICPFGEREASDRLDDLYPDFLFESKNECIVFPECFEYHGDFYE